MPSPLARYIGPLLVGTLAGVGALLASTLQKRPAQPAIESPRKPLAVEGWWSSEESSPLAHAHPAVVLVDAATSELIDSWDRRTRSRLETPVVRRTSEWPPSGTLILDATTGDLLGVAAPKHERRE